jgi:hypothetical protein
VGKFIVNVYQLSAVSRFFIRLPELLRIGVNAVEVSNLSRTLNVESKQKAKRYITADAAFEQPA